MPPPKLFGSTSSRTDLRLLLFGRTAKTRLAVRASRLTLWPFYVCRSPPFTWPLPNAHPASRGCHLAPSIGPYPGEGTKQWKWGPCGLLCALSLHQRPRPEAGTRCSRADGTSRSSCGGLLKWLTSRYHLKYGIIYAWVPLFRLRPWTCLFHP